MNLEVILFIRLIQNKLSLEGRVEKTKHVIRSEALGNGFVHTRHIHKYSTINTTQTINVPIIR